MATPTVYLRKQFVPLSEAKIGVMTHAFNYGTGCFEGIRGNWNPSHGQTYLFRAREHFQRLRKSCRILRIELPYSDDELVELAVQVVARSGYEEDVYVRPLAYKSSEEVGVRLNRLQDDLLIYVVPFGPYLDIEKGIRCQTSSWRRVEDAAIPVRAKVTGVYVNSALAKMEAIENGFDEAIMLDERGHISEGSGENLFLVMDGQLVTPPVSDNILVGITRHSVITLAREELGIEAVERSIDRSEVYVADECFLTGTAAHVAAVLELDRRPIGEGVPGPVTRQIQALYFQTVRGELPKYRHWCTPASPKLVRA